MIILHVVLPDRRRSVLLDRVSLGEDDAERHLALRQPVCAVDVQRLRGERCVHQHEDMDEVVARDEEILKQEKSEDEGLEENGVYYDAVAHPLSKVSALHIPIPPW